MVDGGGWGVVMYTKVELWLIRVLACFILLNCQVKNCLGVALGQTSWDWAVPS